jgi:hypothetical protein
LTHFESDKEKNALLFLKKNYLHLKQTVNRHQTMNCKNCEAPLTETASFCSHCGAKVVSHRITTKSLVQSVADQFFGWDNKYLQTILMMLRRPELVLSSYINGTRKRFMAPFALLAINTALSMLIFNHYSEEFLDMMDTMNQAQFEAMAVDSDDSAASAEYRERQMEQQEYMKAYQNMLVKNLNIFTFLFIPFFALIAFLVFRKPYNYGEHLVIVTYIQGTISLISLILFFLSIAINPAFYSISLLTSILFYLYAYGRLNKYSFKQIILKFLKFIGVLLLLTIILTIIMVVYVVIKKTMGS